MLKTFLNDTIYKVKIKTAFYYRLLEERDKEIISRTTKISCLGNGNIGFVFRGIELKLA